MEARLPAGLPWEGSGATKAPHFRENIAAGTHSAAFIRARHRNLTGSTPQIASRNQHGHHPNKPGSEIQSKTLQGIAPGLAPNRKAFSGKASSPTKFASSVSSPPSPLPPPPSPSINCTNGCGLAKVPLLRATRDKVHRDLETPLVSAANPAETARTNGKPPTPQNLFFARTPVPPYVFGLR